MIAVEHARGQQLKQTLNSWKFSRWRETIGLVEGQPDRSKSRRWRWHPQFVSHFAMDRQGRLQPRANPIDKNRYEVHFGHFEDGKDRRYRIDATIDCKVDFVSYLPIRNQLSNLTIRQGRDRGINLHLARANPIAEIKYFGTDTPTSYRYLRYNRQLEVTLGVILGSVWAHGGPLDACC